MMRPNGSARKLPPQNSRPGPGGAVAAHIAVLVPDAVHAGHIDAVGDGVRALDGLPRIVLRRAELVFLCRVPADGGGIKQHLAPCSAVSRAPSGYHWSQQTSVPTRPNARIDGLESKIAGREVELLVVERIVGDVHLAIDAGDAAVLRPA